MARSHGFATSGRERECTTTYNNLLGQRTLLPLLEVAHETEPAALLSLRKHLHILIRGKRLKTEHLDLCPCLLAEMQTSLYHSSIVEHHECSRWQMLRERCEAIFTHLTATIEKQLGAISLCQGKLGNALIGQWVVKLIYCNMSCLYVHHPI